MIDDRDLGELRHALLTGLTIGVGSIVLVFANGVQILIQCGFECAEGNEIRAGHGEDVASSPMLFGYLDCVVQDAVLDSDSVLTLQFEDGKSLRILPEGNGFESYVVTTRYGISPVVVG